MSNSYIINLDSYFGINTTQYFLSTGDSSLGIGPDKLASYNFIYQQNNPEYNYSIDFIPDSKPFVYRDMLSYLNMCSNTISYMPTNADDYSEAIADSVRNSYTYLFHYSNSIWSESNSTINDNQYLIRYEDIQGKSKSAKINLSSDINITDFINVLDQTQENAAISNISFYNGAFLYPDIKSINNLLTDGGERDSILIKPGESISVPLTFEYYLNSELATNEKISKSIIFAIKDSLSDGPKYYEIEITGNNTVQELNTIFTNIDNFTLTDSITIND